MIHRYYYRLKLCTQQTRWLLGTEWEICLIVEFAYKQISMFLLLSMTGLHFCDWLEFTSLMVCAIFLPKIVKRHVLN
jgi:hypothetical protein